MRVASSPLGPLPSAQPDSSEMPSIPEIVLPPYQWQKHILGGLMMTLKIDVELFAFTNKGGSYKDVYLK
jgi:hypothetical protein